MKKSIILSYISMIISIVVVGCEKAPAPVPAPAKSSNASAPTEEAHAHGSGPNGGVLFDFGKYHAEFTVDHPKSECTVLILEGENSEAKIFPVTATELTLTTKETKTADGKVVPPMTVKLLPVDAKDGKASKFVGTDPGISNVADFAGTVLGEVDGKPSQGEFQE